jgi:hypothetical protein
LAFDSDDEDERPRGGASKSDPSELGALAAGLPSSERRSSAPPGPDADDAMDATALAALSQGRSGRPPRAVAEDAGSSRVKLSGAPLGAAARSPAGSASTPPARGASFGWLIGLAIGLAVGVPVGGVLFPHTTVVSVPAPAPKPSITDREAQLAAAEARARAADAVAAAVRPLSAQRTAEPAQPAQPASTEASPPQPPTAAETAQPSAGDLPPTAASALAAGKKLVGPDAHTREAARAATAALNAQPPGQGVAAQGAPSPQPSAAQTPPVAATTVPQAAAPVGPDGRSVDELLDQALASSTARKEQERAERALAPPDALPLTPSREDVTRAMTVILPAIRGCAAGQSGLATVGLVVKNDGRVESATVSGAPFEGDRTGRCMEGVVRRAKFPRFQQSSFRIQFPFAIQ